MIIWHNNRCRKSRNAVELLESEKIQFEVVKYLENPPTKQELKTVIKKLGIEAEDLVRKGEAIFKENYKGKNLTEEQWIEAMVEHPKLIERPIIINGDQAVIGRPAENILKLK